MTNEQIENATILANWLDKHNDALMKHDAFYMNQWRYRMISNNTPLDFDEAPTCGMAGCAAGWASRIKPLADRGFECINNNGPRVYTMVEGVYTAIAFDDAALEQFFGMTRPFYPMCYEDYDTNNDDEHEAARDITPRLVAHAIRMVIANPDMNNRLAARFPAWEEVCGG